MQEFKLPDLGEGMEEAEIRHWLVKPGDKVQLDQAMVQVETDKAVVEIPSPVAGRIAAIRVPEGTVAKLGEVLVVFDTDNVGTSHRPSESVANIVSEPVKETVLASPVSSGNGKQQRILAAPAVRKRAFELGIELAAIPSSHPTGRVTMDDIQAYVEHAQQKPATTPSVVPEAQHGQTNGAGKSCVFVICYARKQRGYGRASAADRFT